MGAGNTTLLTSRTTVTGCSSDLPSATLTQWPGRISSRYILSQQHLGSRHPSGTSVAGCSREAWLSRLMLMPLQKNAGLVGIPSIP
jgi:hypothetical protein